MKKFFALLFVLTFVGSGLGFACDCCPGEGTGALDFPTLHASSTCCPWAEGKNCGIEVPNPTPLFSSKIQIPTLSWEGEVFLLPLFSHFGFVSDLPSSFLFSPKVPLYLIHRVLRL